MSDLLRSRQEKRFKKVRFTVLSSFIFIDTKLLEVSHFSVKLSMQKFYYTGSEITFKLMQREKGTAVAIPVTDSMWRVSNALLPVFGSTLTTVYSKLLHADHQQVKNFG